MRSRWVGMGHIARELRCGKGLSQKVCTEIDKEAAEPSPTAMMKTCPPGWSRRSQGEAGRSHCRLTPLGIALLQELTGRSCQVSTIARARGMSKDALASCRDRQPEVDDVCHAGPAREHDALVTNLRIAADACNIVANIFLLKARHQYREGEAFETILNVSLNTGGVLVVLHKMTMAEFLEERPWAGENRRLHVFLRCGGHEVNHKRPFFVYS